jgi:hypothetical protein
MSELVHTLKPNSLLLLNESFSSTNRREGSEIAGQIVRALLEGGIKVFFVTYLFHFARDMFFRKYPRTRFLRAEDGQMAPDRLNCLKATHCRPAMERTCTEGSLAAALTKRRR